mmetsp:Transcript_98/g.260  ORF Transcript_98/g.260 Transcript_98/m.260 type:complete len:492 (+) Transcript_98:87-1562(+)
MTHQPASDFPANGDFSDDAAAMCVLSPGTFVSMTDGIDWCSGLLEQMDANEQALAPGPGPKHRRTLSAPPNLGGLVVGGHTGLTGGKRPERSPLPGHGGARAQFDAPADPFADVLSPAHKKHMPPAIDAEGTHPLTKDAASAPASARRGYSRSKDADADPVPSLEDGTSDTTYPSRGRGADGPRDGKTIPWTSTEDKVICEGVELHGFKWSLISMSLPGRTDNAVRNRWHRLEQARRWREEMQAQMNSAQADGTSAPGQNYPGYKCRRCGQPKRGHVCPYEDTTQLPAPKPLPPPQPPKAPKERSRGHGARSRPAWRAGSAPPQTQEATLTMQAHPMFSAPRAPPRSQQAPRPANAHDLSVPPAAPFDIAAAAHGQPTPSPQRAAFNAFADMPLSAHLRTLDSGFDNDMINVRELEDLLFGSLPLDLSDLPSTSPLKTMTMAPSPLHNGYRRGVPPALTSIPSGEPMNEPVPTSMPTLERQSTPQQVISAN